MSEAIDYEALADSMDEMALQAEVPEATRDLSEAAAALRQAAQDKAELDRSTRSLLATERTCEELGIAIQWPFSDVILELHARIEALEQALQDYVAEVAYNRWVERFEGILGDGAKR